MKPTRLFLILTLLWPTVVGAQITYKWTPVPIDSTWDAVNDPSATLAIEKYRPQLSSIQEILGYSVGEYSKERPESGLSNLAADILREMGQKKTGRDVQVALTNFGGIRNSLPKGAVRVYDILAIFPFDNSLVVFDIKGSDLRNFLTRMVTRNRVEALSGVEIEAVDRKIVKLNVAGEPIDDNRMYCFATINFLVDGGDGITLRDMSHNYIDTGLWIRDVIIEYFKDTYQDKKSIELHPDGRIKLSYTKKSE